MRNVLALLTLAALGSPLKAQSTALEARIAEALNLPRTVESGRRAGVTNDAISRVLDALERRRVPAADAEEILRREVDAVRSGQPKDNFGAFVNSQLDRGLRGRELANAIHEEQARRGMGSKGGSRGSDEDAKSRGKERPPAATPEAKGRANDQERKARDERKDASDTTKGQGKGRRP